MSRKLPVLLVLSVAVLASFVALGPSRRSNSQSPSFSSALQAANQRAAHARILSSYGKLPLSFEKNQGQTDDRVRFLARGEGYALFLTGQEAVLRLEAPIVKETRLTVPPAPGSAKTLRARQKPGAVVRLSLAGSNQDSPVEGLDPQSGRSNYLIGNDPAKWRTGVPQYARVKYRGVYPGIDLIYYGNQSQLESDYVLAPGADPKQIALRVEGADSLSINSSGDLVLATSAGEVLLHRPFAYQEAGGARQEISSNFVQRGPRTVGIEVASYDSTRALIVDPVLVYSTYLGVSANNVALGIAVDSAGNAYLTGFTTSSSFPTKGPLSCCGTLNGATQAAFVTKLNPGATALVYSTYLGGSTNSNSSGNGIVVDTANPSHAFVTGGTDAPDFPVAGTPIQSTNNALGSQTVFLSELDPTGASLLYSTFLGGSLGEVANGIAIDATSRVYITGSTSSTNFPITSGTAFQTTNNSKGGGTAFVSQIDTTKAGLAGLLYSTYLGGSKSDTANAIAVNSSGNAFITGVTGSADFPLMSAFQSAPKNGTGANAFVARIDTTLSGSTSLVYSTYLGGATGLSSQGTGIALESSTSAAVVGNTDATDFPLSAGALQTTTNAGNSKAFVSVIDTTKSTTSLVSSTYFGGFNGTQDLAHAVTTDSLGNIYLTGFTNSSDLPTSPGAPQTTLKGTRNVFVSELNPTLTTLLFSTYLGGLNASIGNGIVVDSSSPINVYVAGTTTSPNFPTTVGSFQPTFNLLGDAFVTKISLSAASGVFVTPSSINFGTVNLNSPSSPQTATLSNKTSTTLSSIVITFTGPNASDFSKTSSSTCGATLAAGASCTINVIFTPTTSGAETATLNIADSDSSSPQTVPLSGTGSATSQPDFTLSVTPSSVSVTGGAAGNFTVNVTSQNNFSSAVALSCTGAPLNSTCVLSPTSVTPPAAGSLAASGTITTVALTPPNLPSSRRFPPVGVLGIFSLMLALLLAREAARRGARKLAWGFALFGVLALAGCSGVPGGGAGGGGSTPKGTTTLTITGTSGALTHTTTFALTVN